MQKSILNFSKPKNLNSRYVSYTHKVYTIYFEHLFSLDELRHVLHEHASHETGSSRVLQTTPFKRKDCKKKSENQLSN